MPGPKFPILDLEGPMAKELSLEDRYATLVNIYKIQYFATYRHIAKHLDWETANQIADDMAAEAVPMVAEGYRRKFGLPGEGAALVAQVLQAEFQIEGGDCSAIIETEEEAEYTVACGFGAALQSGKYDDVDITDGLCDRGCLGWTQQVADTVKEGLKVERTEWMGDGCERCHFTIKPSGD